MFGAVLCRTPDLYGTSGFSTINSKSRLSDEIELALGQGSVVAIWLEQTTAVAALSFGGRDRRSVVANGAKANDALFAVCRVLRPSQGRLSGFTTEKF